MPTDRFSNARLIIPFGVARVTEANRAVVPRVEIDVAAGLPLRLGDGPYRRGVVAEEASGSADDNTLHAGAARVDLLRRLHLRDCDVFDKHLRRWLDLYFEFAADRARAFSEKLPAPGRRGDAVLDPLLWVMAALRPLPRAHLPAAGDALVGVDVALWDGATLIAIVFAGGERARRARRLAEPARLLTVDPPAGSDGPDSIAAQLGAAIFDYWGDRVVPPDPFGPSPFRAGGFARPAF